MATLKDLAARMNARADGLDEEVSRIAADTALVIVESLARDTPVDVSTALSGWQIGLGSPVRSTRPAFVPGEQGSTYELSAEYTIFDARQALQAKTPGQPIYISNNEDYIIDLNLGSSRQHPGMFVEIAVFRGRRYLKTRRNDRS